MQHSVGGVGDTRGDDGGGTSSVGLLRPRMNPNARSVRAEDEELTVEREDTN